MGVEFGTGDAEESCMPAGFLGRAPRVTLLVAVALLATATLTFAATSTTPPTTPAAVVPATERAPLVVPDVRRQADVFAKGTLEQAGFAWRVRGPAQGFAANTVVAQTPAAGAKVIADRFPIVVLRLAQNGSYAQDGVPENASPYEGRRARLFGVPKAKPKSKSKPESKAKPRPKVRPGAKPKPARSAAAPKPAQEPATTKRPAAFQRAGAPREPLDEAPLTARADRLAAWVEAHPTRTRAGVNHWLYQHNWIVTGARFGWWRGDRALRTLIAVDRRVQELWGLGGRSERLARRALTEVEARSR